MKKAREYKVVECKGTPYEIGHQYGEACKDSLKKSLEMNFVELLHGENVSREDIISHSNKFFELVKEFDSDFIDFLKGEAEGSGISFDEAFFLRCSTELGLYYGKISSLCTSFAVTGEATKDSKTILGQNIDWFSGYPVDLLKIKYNNGLEQLVLSLGGVAEYILSSAGLGVCLNLTVPPSKDYSFNMPFGCYLQKAMRQHSLSDALEVLCQYARGIVYYQLASVEGDLVGIESVFNDFNVMQPEKDMMVHSNHYLTERFQRGDWGYFIFPDTYLRVNRIKKLMEQNYGSITPELMMKIMADHNNYPNSICRHRDEQKPPEFHSETLASIIMIPEDRVMYITLGNPCEFKYVEYKL